MLVRIVAATALLAQAGTFAAEPGGDFYGGDAGGRRFSEVAQAMPANIGELRRQWLFRTGDPKPGRQR
jgi:quinoprotein glucose dehydrogenase